jgi:hypothetical protein
MTGCYALDFLFQTLIYFGLVWILWYCVALEVAGKGGSILTPRTGLRALTDMLAILFGEAIGAFGALLSNRIGSSVNAFLVGMTYIIWAITIIAFYSRDLWLHIRRPQQKHGNPGETDISQI